MCFWRRHFFCNCSSPSLENAKASPMSIKFPLQFPLSFSFSRCYIFSLSLSPSLLQTLASHIESKFRFAFASSQLCCSSSFSLLLLLLSIITEHKMAPPSRTNGYEAVSLERQLLKHVRDNVHGNIFLEPIFLKFVDTEQFQRLRDLKQLGLTHMVYPGAVHSRFEHSLGVYWLAGKAIDVIKKYQGPELGIEHSDVLTVKLAGLLHDVGHGPFSHMFEHGFLPLVLNDYGLEQ